VFHKVAREVSGSAEARTFEASQAGELDSAQLLLKPACL
jgi:hypothetical protein